MKTNSKNEFSATHIWETEFYDKKKLSNFHQLTPQDKERLRDLSKIRQDLRKKR